MSSRVEEVNVWEKLIDSEDSMEDKSSEGAVDRPSTVSAEPSSALSIFAFGIIPSRSRLTFSSASSSLATAAATPRRTARSRSGRSKMCDELACRI